MPLAALKVVSQSQLLLMPWLAEFYVPRHISPSCKWGKHIVTFFLRQLTVSVQKRVSMWECWLAFKISSHWHFLWFYNQKDFKTQKQYAGKFVKRLMAPWAFVNSCVGIEPHTAALRTNNLYVYIWRGVLYWPWMMQSCIGFGTITF